MLQRLKNKIADKRLLKSDGIKVSTSFNVIVNNEQLHTFDNYSAALDWLTSFRKVNRIFNLSVFRVEFYSLISDLTSNPV